MLTRLLILWLLSEGPLHGYRIRRMLSDDGFAAWLRIDDASIYSMLRTLTKEALVHAVAPPATTGPGPAPKAAFRITPKGRRHYAELLSAAWREPLALAQPIALALAAQADLESARLRALLDERVSVLQGQRGRLLAARAAAPHAALVDRGLALIDAELAWLGSYAKQLQPKERRHGR